MEYGSAPKDLGEILAEASEMMFVQYLPIVMPELGPPRLPPNLAWTRPMVMKAIADFGGQDHWYNCQNEHYVYLTARHMYVAPENMGNRPGWHSDGFMTPDINYIWYDSAPTEFCIQPFRLSQDHVLSMAEMDQQADVRNIVTYPTRRLLRLDEGVVHRVAAGGMSGFRTFVKISISQERYNLRGNSHNYLFNYDWDLKDRAVERNHPVQ